MMDNKSNTNTSKVNDVNKLTMPLTTDKSRSSVTDVLSDTSSASSIPQCIETPTVSRVRFNENVETFVPVVPMSDKEIAYMEKAFYYAREALENQEVPVGCIFVYKDQIVALGRNTVNETRNATRHAEINCIEQVTSYCKDKGLDVVKVFSRVHVYVTVEPCIMCAAALYNLNVASVVFGCRNDRFGGITVLNVRPLMKPRTEVKGGYREEEAMALLKTFYKGTNPNAPPSKVKVKNV